MTWKRHIRIAGQLATALGLGLVLTGRAAEWRYYTVGEGLPDDRVHGLAQALDGAIWAATAAGPARYADGTWSTLAGGAFEARALAQDGQGRVWVGGRDATSGVLRLYGADGTPVSPLPPGWEERLDGEIRALVPEGAEEMWIVTDAGVRKWRRGAVTFTPELLPFDPVGDYRCVAIDAAGVPWIGGDGGLWRFEDGAAIDAGPPLPDGSVRQNTVVSLVALPGGGLLVGNLEGEIWKGGMNEWESVPLLPNPNSSSIRACRLDRAGNLWVAREAVFRLRNVVTEVDPALWPLDRFDATNGVQGAPIHALLDAFDADANEIWLGGQGGISVLRAPNWQVVDSGSGLLGDRAHRCAYLSSCNHITRIASGGDELWAGAVEGLSHLRGEDAWTGWVTALIAGPPDAILDNRIRALQRDDDGTTWVASGFEQYPGGPRSGGLQVLAPGAGRDDWSLVGRAADDPKWLIQDMARDDGGDLWLASHDGVWRMQTNAADTILTRFDPAVGAPTPPIAAVASAGDHVVAASSLGELGVYSRSADSWTPWSLADRIVDGASTAIRRVAIHEGMVYVATARGLVVESVSASDLGAARLVDGTVGYADDLRDLAFDRDGFLLVASNVGLLRTDPDLSRWRRLAEADGLVSSNLSAVAVRGEEIWLGSRGDGLMRHVFVAPDTEFERLPTPAVGARDLLTLRVRVSDPDSPPNSASHQWRIDEGLWSSATNSAEIAFVPSDEGIAHGLHRLQIRAIDTEFNVEAIPAEAFFELDLIPPTPLVASPRQGDVVAGATTIRGSVEDPRFEAYRVTVRPRDDADAPMTELVPWSTTEIVDGPLATWNTESGEFPDGWYELELSIRDQIEVMGTTRIELLVDNEFPFAAQSSPLLMRAAEGGTLYEVGGGARVVFPPFALGRDQSVALDAVDAGTAFALSAAQDRFDKPAVLRIHEAGTAKQALAIYRDEDGSWQRLGGTQVEAGVWDVSIQRTGRYALRADAGEPGTGAVLSALSTEPRLLRPRGGNIDRMAIGFSLQRPSSVHAVVYSRNGRPRRVLADGLPMGSGAQMLYWDGRDHDGEFVAPALYIVCVEANGERATQVVSVGRSQ